MTSEKTYQIVAKELPIPYTDWNDSKDVDKRRRELQNHKIDCICSFEKLYAKYISGKYIPLSSNDYYNVFKKILYDHRNKNLHNIMINLGFVLS